ncbi:predicted protein [Ostreococcus lucimarinus CCE9901]|uniref:Uncharacterized protein n=1 Tax=Ostreococcus lucimarinus (strain CCE9901) TaxID=436017 RepID=A4S0Q5_OSTLU|nr:predicted protein [Ostreococcus lucimarinus CCE9901]ABO97073.1 predicted protein [Ostreococcus lucimarinus CCE9901]|eukprot:XP_001418780.1 predicted protein [Ostreococcus lucimarinus CCE9901]
MVAVFVLGAATLGTVVINVKRNAMKKMSGSMFEDEARRAAAAKERVDGIAKLLEEVNAKANAAEEKLEAAMREKNAIERVLEEMERTKANMKVENMELRDSVTVLKNDLNNATERHQLVVRKWRDELVTYREKSPQDFLAEVIGLVSDMDNEVTIEVIPPEAPRAAKVHEEVRLEECEWEYNPRLAVADSTRLLMLANSGRVVKKTREEKVKKVTGVKPVASPHRATTPTRAALGKLTNTGVQRAQGVAHKAARLVQANHVANTPPPKVATSDRSIEFGECLLFEKQLKSPVRAPKIGGGRAGVIGGFEAEDVMPLPSSPATIMDIAIRR